MPFFPNYPKVPYQFGQESFTIQFPDLVRYSEILDVVKNNGSFYQKYYIRNGWRPDNVSQELYNTPSLHWTFFYLNDGLREKGWPLDQYQIEEKIQDDFPNTVLTTNEEMFSTFNVGSTVTGLTTEETGRIIKKNVDLGQIFVEGTPEFSSEESITVEENDVTYILALTNVQAEKDAALYYVTSGEKVDIDPFAGPDSDQLPVSYEDYYLTENLELRDIIVMKPEIATQFKVEFKDTMTSTDIT